MTKHRKVQPAQETFPEPLSPELVLVDPQLASLARERLRLVGDGAVFEKRAVVRATNQGPVEGRADARTANAEYGEGLVGDRLAVAQTGLGSRDDRGSPVAGAESEIEFSADSPEDADEDQSSPRASPHRLDVFLAASAVFAILAAGFSILQLAHGVRDAGEGGFRPLTTPIESMPVQGMGDARKDRRTSESPHTRAGTASPPTKPAVQPKKRLQPLPQREFPTRVFIWPAVSRATFYKVEFFRHGRKIFEASPTIPRIELPLRWAFRGRRFRLTPAIYRWEVRAAFGPRSGPRYGQPITQSTWTAK
jgi:hypothetical protein